MKYPGEREFGIPSPGEQSRRHERVLEKALDFLGVTGRVSARPTLRRVVLVHPNATINRPSSKTLDTTMVIKADQFRSWHERHLDKDARVVTALTGILNVRSSKTVQSWGEGLAQLHRPPDPLVLPAFMSPKPASEAWIKPAATPPKVANDESGKQGRKLICATCGSKISFPEGKYCWNNEARFGGKQYCREHQAAFK